MRTILLTFLLLAATSFVACTKKACADPAANNFNNEANTFDNSNCTYDPVDPTLYKRLGEIEGVTNLVDQFIVAILGDPELKQRFLPTVSSTERFDLFRLNLIDQFCEAAEGPCIYKGKTMYEAHLGMDITKQEFDFVVNALINTMNDLNINSFDQQHILRLFGPMEEDIVQ